MSPESLESSGCSRSCVGAAEPVRGERAAQDGLDAPCVEAVLARERVDGVADEKVEQDVERIGLDPAAVDHMQTGGTIAMTARARSASMLIPHGSGGLMPLSYSAGLRPGPYEVSR